MNTTLKKLHAVVFGALFPTLACAELIHDFGTQGYFRIGTGTSSGGSDQEVFKAPGAGAKYRLGNENDTWVELDVYDTVRLEPEGAYVHLESMGIFNGEQNEMVDFDEIIQLFAEAGDFTTALGNPKVWIGRRYYDRHDIHINDFFFLNTLQGFDGGGVRDLDLGIGKLAFAFGRQDLDDDSSTVFDESRVAQSRFDVRLSDIATNNNGSLTFWGAYDTSNGTGAAKSLDGYAFGVMHTQEEFFGGFNKFIVQYGRGLGRHAGRGGLDGAVGTVTTSAAESDFDSAETFRVVNTNVIESSPDWSMMTSFVYEATDSSEFDGTDQTWISVGVRPVWFVNEHFRIPVEVGWDYVDDHAADTDGSLVKATVAGEFALDRGFWQRPVLRVFGTYAKWSDSFEGQVGGDTFANDTSGWSFGVQAESWW